MCQVGVGRWSESRGEKAPQGYMVFTKADPISSHFSLKSAFEAKRRAPSALHSLPGLCGSGPACSWGWLKPTPFFPFGEPGWTLGNLTASLSLALK